MLSVLSCNKQEIPNPNYTTPKSIGQDSINLESDNGVSNLDTNVSQQYYLVSTILDDSLTFNSNTVDSNGYMYHNLSNDFQIRLNVTDTNKIMIGSYTNEYLVYSSDNGFDLLHSVYVGDNSVVTLNMGGTSTQIIGFDITKIENDRMWVSFDLEWHYTHWLHTEKNKSGTIKGELNGFKYK